MPGFRGRVKSTLSHRGRAGPPQASVRAALEIKHNIGARPAAANQEIALPRRLERLGEIIDCAGDKPALAIVADAGATRPPDRDIAGLGQFE